MPIYEFKCAKCGNLAEVVQRVGDRPPPCPSCGSKRMTRAVSRTSFHLKGGGWYADLYGTPRPGKGEGAEGGKVGEEKPVASAGPEGGAKPATPAGAAPAPAASPTAAAAARADASPGSRPASGSGQGPSRRRPAPPRKRR